MAGWNGSDLRGKTPIQPKVTAKKPSPWRGLFAGAIVVLLAAGGAYFLLSKPAAKVSDGELDEDRMIKERQPAKVKNPSASTDSAVSKVGPMTQAKAGERYADVATEVTEAAVTNGGASAEDNKQKDDRLFKNAMDQLLAMVAPRNVGDGVPPLPIVDDMKFSEEDEKKILERLTADDKDSDAVLERKELVQSMRDEYQELKKKGWTFVDYVKALEAKAKLDTEVLEESHKIHETVFNDPNITDAEYLEMLEKINKVLSDRGIKPISPPSDETEGGEQTAETESMNVTEKKEN